MDAGGVRVGRNVRSMLEIRQEHTVRQAWDRSCGAAALSTIMTHHYGDNVSEISIILSVFRTVDPRKIRERKGFSLLDLKRVAESRGYEGKGYTGMGLDDLSAMGAPAIVPVRMKGYDHYVVYRGMRGDRVSVSDPAYGSVTMKKSAFAEIWKDGIGFFVFRKGVAPAAGTRSGADEYAVSDAASIGRSILRKGAVSASRRGP